MKKEEVEREILFADLHGVLGADEAEVPPELGEELTQIEKKGLMKIGFGVAFGQIQKFDDVAVLEHAFRLGMQLVHHW